MIKLTYSYNISQNFVRNIVKEFVDMDLIKPNYKEELIAPQRTYESWTVKFDFEFKDALSLYQFATRVQSEILLQKK